MINVMSEHDASPAHFANTLDFDATLYGVDVDAGTVDGERIGIMSAIMCALVRQEMWPDPNTVPRRRPTNGSPNGTGAHHGQPVDVDLTSA